MHGIGEAEAGPSLRLDDRENVTKGENSLTLKEPQSEGRHSLTSGSPSLRGDTAPPQGAEEVGR